MDSSDYEWFTPEELAKPKEGHALIHLDTWCRADDQGRVAIYKKHYVQGNKNKVIADRLTHVGTQVILVPVIILRDSPSRYY